MEPPRREPDLRFPFNTRLALLAWRALYFRPRAFESDPFRSEEWNRGAYLTEGLGPCDMCDSPRGLLGGFDMDHAYGGAPLPSFGWYAPPLGTASPAGEDDAAELARLLKTGVSARNVTTGPMAEVVYHSLQYLRADDIDAIVTYIASLPPPRASAAARTTRVSERTRQALLATGASVYERQCTECHGDRGQGEPYVYPALAGNSAVTSPSAANAIRALLFGGYAPSTAGNPRPYGMPPYSHQLSDHEIAAVLTFVRGALGKSAPAVSPVEVARY
jgi:mono/diheme cytochrome c family protein